MCVIHLVALITPITQKSLITQNKTDNTDSPYLIAWITLATLIAVNITPIMIITSVTRMDLIKLVMLKT